MEIEEEQKAGSPAWVVTFADLMSLLMSFFVMLLSFAEMDAMKFKQVAESLEKAFGVQREVKVIERPMGTSPDQTHFSPGRPEPTSSETVKQDTSQVEPHLRTYTADGALLEMMREASNQQIERTLRQLREELDEELGSGQLQLERDERRLILRIEERGSFPSGSADFDPTFRRSLTRISSTLALVPGELSIEGHTDDVPMKSARFRSNWELSSSRAAAVATALLAAGDIPAQRMRVQGFAETRPRVPNDSNPNRALNRRVEVIIDLQSATEELEKQVRELIEAGREDLVPELGWD